MINVLIPTKPDDVHALYVKLALEKKGHHATLWYTADFPEWQKHTFTLSGAQIDWCAQGLEFAVDNNHKFDVVWLRRPQRPMIPDYLHHEDRESARNENTEFFKYFWQVIAPQAYWINPVNHVTPANCKIQQLKAAVEVGFNIPDSLFSNDPAAIRSFLANYPDNQVVFKTIYPVYWVSDDTLRLTYTNVINKSMLPSDAVLQATPGIYQRKIEKKYELRVTFMGDKAVTVKLNSQNHPDAKVDWRSVSSFVIGVEDYQLPNHVREQCIGVMRKLGVAFGCFDFIVTPDDEYYFLEINEQGQFLWVEEANPAIKMLDPFTNYLIECGGGRIHAESEVVSLADFNDYVHLLRRHAVANHKDTGLIAR